MRTLFLNGTVGVGKTSVADAVGSLLTLDGVTNAVIDVDWLARVWPAPVDDRFNFRLALRNLEAMAANFDRAGVRMLVIAGVIENRAQLENYQRVLGEDLWLCRLTVDAAEGIARLRRRHVDDGELDWHLHRAGELHRILEASGLDDTVLDTTGVGVVTSASEALRQFGAGN
jgi:adenylylsulfate kinase